MENDTASTVIKEEVINGDDGLGGADTANLGSAEDVKMDLTNAEVGNAGSNGGTGIEDRVSALLKENQRLQGIFASLAKRQTQLEEFIEVQHGPQFDSFVTKRTRLVDVMGLNEEDDLTKITGQRSEKSKELVNLLKAAKGQNDEPPNTGYKPTINPEARYFNPKQGKGKKNRGGGKNANAYQNWQSQQPQQSSWAGSNSYPN